MNQEQLAKHEELHRRWSSLSRKTKREYVFEAPPIETLDDLYRQVNARKARRQFWANVGGYTCMTLFTLFALLVVGKWLNLF